MRERGTEIHVRAVFLQGLLLLEANEMPNFLTTFDATCAAWRTWLHERHIGALAGALGFVLADTDNRSPINPVDWRRA